MKRFVTCFVFLGLLGLTACSGDSPSAPPVPTVVPDVWAIPALNVSSTSAQVGYVLVATAQVTKNGSPAPDATSVEFTIADGCSDSSWDQNGDGLCASFYRAKTARATVATANGQASIAIVIEEPGARALTARVVNAERTVTLSATALGPSDELQIVQPLIPNQGAIYNVGEPAELVVLRGKGIRPPAEVTFILTNGQRYPAEIEQVIESSPRDAYNGEIHVRTPYLSGLTLAERAAPQEADVEVTVGVGTESTATETLLGAFTFVPTGDTPVTTADEDLAPLLLYVVNPDNGPAAGGNTVTIVGRNFRGLRYDQFGNIIERPEAVSEVRFGNRAADIVAISPDGLQLQVTVPRLQTNPLETNRNVNVTVTTSFADETFSDTLNEGYVYLADQPEPTVLSIAPIAGPVDGGTLVTIYGHGFQVPVQVQFGDLAAIDVNVTDDPTLADNDIITCLTPDYSNQPNSEPPFAVNVKVTNLQTGKNNTLNGAFTYGEDLYISGNTPYRAHRGELVVIFGSGFEDPLRVFLLAGTNPELEVVTVSGSELLVRIPDNVVPDGGYCNNVPATFRVVLTESSVPAAEGGDFVLLGNVPEVLDAKPTNIQADATDSFVTPTNITIEGAEFADDVIVQINDYRVPSSDITVVNSTTIDVRNIPAPNDFGFSWRTESCVAAGGLPGVRLSSTAVSVSVSNFPGDCNTTLDGALIYEPGDNTCNVAASIAVGPISFPATEVPGPSLPAQTIDINNNGAGTLDVQSMNLLGRFYFDAGCSLQAAPGVSIPPFGFASPAVIHFCPDLDNGAAYNGVLTISSNAPGSPLIINLSAQEAFPIMAVNVTTLIFAGNDTQLFTIVNNGTSPLNYSITETSDVDNIFANLTPTAGTINPGDPAVIVSVDMTAATGTDGTLEVTAAETDAQGAPVTITLNAP
jgi:hypothetical protein